MLYLKHRFATSAFRTPLMRLRHRAKFYDDILHPELALLRQEDVMLEAVLSRSIHQDSVCVDVGAHLGSMSWLFQKLAPKQTHLIIEAVPQKADWLRKAFPKQTIAQCAVSDEEGQVTFYENLDKPGFSSLGDRAGRTREISVACTTLDKLLADKERVDFIKIDVEGFELNVVRGAQRTLHRCRPLLMFEAGAATDDDIDNDSYIALLDLLTDELGYEVRPVFGEFYGREPISQDEFQACRRYPFLAFNYIARPV